MTMKLFNVFTFRGSRVVRIVGYRERSEALEAACLSE